MRRLLLAVFALALAAACGSSGPERPYVLLISIDGFRSDYATLHGAPNLARIARRGVRAEGLIPSYRTNTFPNHLAIVTGMYPEHHGIVDNVFYDRQRKQTYRYNQKETGGDGSWYGGTPLWVLAEQQGVRSAAFFWPGSDTVIRGTRPSAYVTYGESVPNQRRVDQVLEWLRAPESERPHFVTLYFSDVDTAGHSYGPDSPETARAVASIDAVIGSLLDGLEQIDLPVYVFAVSDHGMTRVTESVRLGTAADFAGFEIAPSNGAQVMLYAEDDKLIEDTVARLNRRNDRRYRAFRREETPSYLHYNEGYRIGDIVVMAAAPVSLTIEMPNAAPREPSPGAHGYDPLVFPEMNGIFYAQGPALQQGLVTYPFENVHIYPLIAHILGLEPPPGVDGSLDVLSGILRN